MDPIITLIVIAIIAVAAYSLIKHYSKEKTKDAVVEVAKPSPTQDLLALNLVIRKAAIGTTLTVRCESIIDKLIILFPKIEKHECASGEFAWTVNRIASEYLPNKCIMPFIKLDTSARDGALDEFVNNIQTLEQELLDIEALLSKHDKKEFDNKSLFLKAKFNAEGKA
ncbi:MAG: hypothetical protein KBT75_08900 [Oleispira antarctica]|uniref:Uncharacterized protein n=1 Tax=Oleispira antarctica RB-8 TaxID=698738 RepID=R4YLR7_OLEAN|nr:hypothetical protein [Oleispira antarctica]MBQ0792304.1 hypothetical protein [Oleispira antarctica]CCK75776.1 hypothetical protein OLEAN_C16000 [Oleispira antarctica RB-8]|tara:strand:- start:461 stop:964 length:504 start_codon:yes stop_codon:yes gene_type:complete